MCINVIIYVLEHKHTHTHVNMFFGPLSTSKLPSMLATPLRQFTRCLLCAGATLLLLLYFCSCAQPCLCCFNCVVDSAVVVVIVAVTVQ